MAVSQATLGFGALLKMGDGASPEVFTTIAENVELGALGETVNLVDVTHHESPDGRREYIAGLKDGDEFNFTANYIPANTTQNETAGVIYVAQEGTKKNWQIVKGGKTFAFSAIVSHWEVTFPLAEQMRLSATLKLSSKIDIT